MALSLSRIILYAHDVNLLKAFYLAHFNLPVIEEIQQEWLVLRAGAMEIAFHRVGAPYRAAQASPQITNTKLVFDMPSGLIELRDKMISAGVPMRDLKRYDGFPYLLCDGEDPEGNVFQLMQLDR